MEGKQQANVDGSRNIIVQAAGDGIHVTIGLPQLTLIPPRRRLATPKPRNVVEALNPYHRAIALVGREADMQGLWDWLHSTRPVGVRTLTGRAGAGKTRAAIELVERLNTERAGIWWAGFVSGSELRRFAEKENLAGWSWARPTLIVVDYAASLIEPLRQWLRELAQNPGRGEGRPLRLLLLEREAAAGEGWLQSLCAGGYSEAGVPELFDPMEPKRLDRLDTAEKRRAVLHGMFGAAAPFVEGQLPKLPAPGQNPRVDEQLKNELWEDPLYLMMAALLSLRSDLTEVLELPRTELALQLVGHEIKRLAEGAPSREAERLLGQVAAFATLAGGFSQETALTVAGEESEVLKLNYPEGAGALVSRVQEVLPGRDHGIAPVVPDILGEALVLRVLAAGSTAQQNAAIKRARQKFGERVVPFILRMVQDFAPTGEAAPLNWLESLIKAGLSDDLGLLMEIESAMPHETLALREKAVEVDELLADRLGKLAEENPSEPVLAEYGRLLNNLANRLSDLGMREEALAKAEGAGRIYAQLAQARPDAFLPYLATSLNNLAIMLSDLGRREEALAKAEDAARLYAQLAQARPDAFLPDLAMSLNNLANMLSALGRREEALAKAEDAVRIRTQLAQTRPDAFLPDLAMSCGARGMVLIGMERHAEAAGSIEQGIRALAPLFQKVPAAFANLMMQLCRNYLQATEQAKIEPDGELLGPVFEVFKRLSQNQTQE